MHFHVFKSKEAIAQFVADQLTAALAAKPTSVLGLTTGTTPLKTNLYKEIVARANAGVIDLSQATLVSPDEFLGIPQAHPETYFTYTHKHLLDHLTKPPGKWIIPKSDTSEPARESARVEHEIRAVGGVDWQWLGIGINGHVAFIEPAAALPSECYVTPIAEVNRQLYTADFGELSQVPTHAITYGLGTLLSARQICLVAVGEGKASIVQSAFFGDVTTNLPASLLQLHANTNIVLDEAAAAFIPANFPEFSPHAVTRHE
jgi:glucosamine-6-phosphate deaminase